MQFVGKLVVEILNDGISARVLEDCGFADASNTVIFPISKGLISDGASIPRPLWATIGSPMTGKYRRAAFAHDQAYRTPGVTKELADTMLRAAAIADGCPTLIADLIYEGVHVGGESSYADDQRANQPLVIASSDAPVVTVIAQA